MSTTGTDKAILYVRVSTARQADEGMSLDAQERQMRAYAEGLGYSDVEIVREEGRSGKSISGRPALSDALGRLDRGEAAALIGLKLDRISRNARDMLEIVDRANRKGWRLVVMDVSLDTATPVGRMVLTILASVAEMERNRIAERQRDSHAERRNRGQVWGVTAGPLSELEDETRRRLVAERASGKTLRAIADELNAEGVPTATGKAWTHGNVAHVLRTPAARRMVAA